MDGAFACNLCVHICMCVGIWLLCVHIYVGLAPVCTCACGYVCTHVCVFVYGSWLLCFHMCTWRGAGLYVCTCAWSYVLCEHACVKLDPVLLYVHVCVCGSWIQCACVHVCGELVPMFLCVHVCVKLTAVSACVHVGGLAPVCVCVWIWPLCAHKCVCARICPPASLSMLTGLVTGHWACPLAALSMLTDIGQHHVHLPRTSSPPLRETLLP